LTGDVGRDRGDAGRALLFCLAAALVARDDAVLEAGALIRAKKIRRALRHA